MWVNRVVSFLQVFLTIYLCAFLSSTDTIQPARQERVHSNFFYDFKGLINSGDYFAGSLGPFCQHTSSHSRKAGGDEVRLSCRQQYELQKYTSSTVTHIEHSISILNIKICTMVPQWFRCCATNRKVAGSIPASVIVFFIDMKSFRSHYGPGVESASNRNEYQEHFLG